MTKNLPAMPTPITTGAMSAEAAEALDADPTFKLLMMAKIEQVAETDPGIAAALAAARDDPVALLAAAEEDPTVVRSLSAFFVREMERDHTVAEDLAKMLTAQAARAVPRAVAVPVAAPAGAGPAIVVPDAPPAPADVEPRCCVQACRGRRMGSCCWFSPGSRAGSWVFSSPEDDGEWMETIPYRPEEVAE